jgi:hypothetical protein
MKYVEGRIYSKEVSNQYFGINCRAFTTPGSEESYSMFPWSFEIEFEGKLIQYSGIPNMVETKEKALKRAWYRCKWLAEGTYDQHYV